MSVTPHTSAIKKRKKGQKKKKIFYNLRVFFQATERQVVKRGR